MGWEKNSSQKCRFYQDEVSEMLDPFLGEKQKRLSASDGNFCSDHMTFKVDNWQIKN